MQYFYLRQNSTLPSLRMDLINDGRHDFHKFHECIQSATIKFTMVNSDTKIAKICNGDGYIKLRDIDSCDEEYVICYDWKPRDTKECGTYIGTFEITFDEKLKNDNYNYPSGILNMPIREQLTIVIL